MKATRIMPAAAALALLCACGGQGSDTVDSTIATSTEAATRSIEGQAEAAAAAGNRPVADQLNEQAAAIRQRGDKVGEAVGKPAAAEPGKDDQ